jgi:hypothetical protein
MLRRARLPAASGPAPAKRPSTPSSTITTTNEAPAFAVAPATTNERNPPC